MRGSALAFGINDEFFRVRFRVTRIGKPTVAQGEQAASDLVEPARAEIGDVPPQHAVANFVAVRSGILPLGDGPSGKSGKRYAEMAKYLPGKSDAVVSLAAKDGWHGSFS